MRLSRSDGGCAAELWHLGEWLQELEWRLWESWEPAVEAAAYCQQLCQTLLEYAEKWKTSEDPLPLLETKANGNPACSAQLQHVLPSIFPAHLASVSSPLLPSVESVLSPNTSSEDKHVQDGILCSQVENLSNTTLPAQMEDPTKTVLPLNIDSGSDPFLPLPTENSSVFSSPADSENNSVFSPNLKIVQIVIPHRRKET